MNTLESLNFNDSIIADSSYFTTDCGGDCGAMAEPCGGDCPCGGNCK